MMKKLVLLLLMLFLKVKKDGITVEEQREGYLFRRLVEGMQLDKGFSPYFNAKDNRNVF